jgi:hypothetical protein
LLGIAGIHLALTAGYRRGLGDLSRVPVVDLTVTAVGLPDAAVPVAAVTGALVAVALVTFFILQVRRVRRAAAVVPELYEGQRRVGRNGHATAWLAVVAGNARARRFYERRGWSDTGPFNYAAAGEDGPISVPSRRYVKHLSQPSPQPTDWPDRHGPSVAGSSWLREVTPSLG